MFAGYVALLDPPLINFVNRLAGYALEDKAHPHLGELRDRLDILAVFLHGYQHRRAGVVVVPKVVVDLLEMPQPLAGPGVKRKRAVGKQVVPSPITTVLAPPPL